MAAQQVPGGGSLLDFHKPLTAAGLTSEQIADFTLRSQTFQTLTQAEQCIETFGAATRRRIMRKTGGNPCYPRFVCCNHAQSGVLCPAYIAVRKEEDKRQEDTGKENFRLCGVFKCRWNT